MHEELSSFSSFRGGEKVNSSLAEFHYSNCVHRSQHAKVYEEKQDCCLRTSVNEYFACLELDIEKLTPAICENCKLFKGR